VNARHPSRHAGHAAARQLDGAREDGPKSCPGEAHEDGPKSCPGEAHEDGPKSCPGAGREDAQRHHPGEARDDGLKSCPGAGHGDDRHRVATSDRRPARSVKDGPHIGSLGDAARRPVPTPLTLLIDATNRSGCTPHHLRRCHGLRRAELHASQSGWRFRRPPVRDQCHLRRMDDWGVHRRQSCALRPHRCLHERCDPRKRNWGDGRWA